MQSRNLAVRDQEAPQNGQREPWTKYGLARGLLAKRHSKSLSSAKRDRESHDVSGKIWNTCTVWSAINVAIPVWELRVVVAQEVVCTFRHAPCAFSLTGANTLCFQSARQGLSTDELELIVAVRQKVYKY